MWTIIIGAIVSLLIFAFEQWWTHNHPARPTPQQRAQFIAQVGAWKYFWMGPKRAEYAGKLFDQFVVNYDAAPPGFQAGDAPLSQSQAKYLAQKYAAGLVL